MEKGKRNLLSGVRNQKRKEVQSTSRKCVIGVRRHPKKEWTAKELPVVLPLPPLSCTVGGVEATPKALGQHDFLLSCKFLAGNEL